MTDLGRVQRVPVDGGTLAVRTWGPDDGRVVLAAHGITSNALAWALVAERLPEARVVALDLRGRGGSRDLPPPYGLRQHAADVAAVRDALGIDRAVLAGHSMGGFVAVLAAADRPAATASVVIVDGAIPLELPAGTALEAYAAALLGPALARLDLTFADEEAYRDLWRAHPALQGAWSPLLEAYVRADLTGEPPRLRASSVRAAVAADTADEFGPDWYLAALRGLRMPVSVLRAPRGLLDGDPLYPAGRIEELRGLVPQLRVVEVDDVNHYTIVLADRGAAAVAAELRTALSAL